MFLLQRWDKNKLLGLQSGLLLISDLKHKLYHLSPSCAFTTMGLLATLLARGRERAEVRKRGREEAQEAEPQGYLGGEGAKRSWQQALLRAGRPPRKILLVNYSGKD